MTRRVLPPARTEITRVVEQHNRQTVSPASEGAVSSDWLDGDLAIVRRVLDRSADEITYQCMTAVAADLERVGLRADLRGADKLHAAVREVVIENLLDALREPVEDLKTRQEVLSRLTVSTTRETILELIAGSGRG
jgi:hypothetical protein